jgi:ABC-type lipopolysaccharide export system ATPase subunit
MAIPETVLKDTVLLKSLMGLADGSAIWRLRALAAKPKRLILDEPTEGIQPSIIKDIGRVICMLADRGDMAI